jgi:hypothetical protein
MSGADRLNGMHTPPARGPAPTKPKELTPDALAGGLYAKRGELKGLARRHGLTLDELARRASEPDASRSISSLRRLAEARAGVLLARARADATALLLTLAESAESDETRRRACVDLLKAPSHASDEPVDGPEEEALPDEGANASLLGLLERLGERSRDEAEGA